MAIITLVQQNLDLILILAAVGAGAGLLSGLFGVGGGIITVPALFTLFTSMGYERELAMHMALGTSLALIVPTGISSARSHYRRGSVDRDVMRQLVGSMIAGALLGGVVAHFVKGSILTLMFGGFSGMIALFMLQGSKGLALVKQLPSGNRKHLLGGGVGMLSAMLGVGGGTMNVPTLLACGYPMTVAVGTGAALGIFISLPGAISYVLTGWGHEGLAPYSLGYVNLLALGLMAPLSILTAPVGSYLSHTLPQLWLRRGFAVLMLVISAKFIYKSF